MHDFTIPIGPQNPSLKEPTCLRIDLKGNYIQSARIRLGYIHRGLERLLEGKDILKALYIIQRICGICPATHAISYTRAIESALKIRLEEDVVYLRMLEAELERIASHLLWAGYMSHEIGYDMLFMFFWRERERVLEIFEKVMGGRIHRNNFKIGSVRYGLEKGDKRFILERLDVIKKNIQNYLSTYRSDRVIKSRLKGVGVITKEDARRLCVVGPVARASGINNDVRRTDPYLAYDDVEFEIPLEDDGDALARAIVRLREILESIKIISQIIECVKEDAKLPEFKPEPFDAETSARSEAPRGENFHFLKIKNGVIERVKVRTPTFANIVALEHMLKGAEIGDTPVVVESLDPCFACMERVLIANRTKVECLTKEQFMAKYVRRGYD